MKLVSCGLPYILRGNKSLIDELVKNILREVKTEYPQIETPGAMRAVIASIQKCGTHERTICLTDKQSGEKREYILEESSYTYSVKIVDNNGNELKQYPIIPDITSNKEYPIGSNVAVVFTGGELAATIVG